MQGALDSGSVIAAEMSDPFNTVVKVSAAD
jgi:hypothetical protein